MALAFFSTCSMTSCRSQIGHSHPTKGHSLPTIGHSHPTISFKSYAGAPRYLSCEKQESEVHRIAIWQVHMSLDDCNFVEQKQQRRFWASASFRCWYWLISSSQWRGHFRPSSVVNLPKNLQLPSHVCKKKRMEIQCGRMAESLEIIRKELDG